MPFDPAWEAEHAKREWGKYPPECLVRFVSTHYRPAPSHAGMTPYFNNFLDLGCGLGSATWYLAREGYCVTAVDASESALLRLRDRFRNDRTDAEFVKFIYDDVALVAFAPGLFDCVIDIACLQHLPEVEAIAVLDSALTWLKPGGRIFSVMTSAYSTRPEKIFERRVTMEKVAEMFAGFTALRIEIESRTTSEFTDQRYVIDAVKR